MRQNTQRFNDKIRKLHRLLSILRILDNREGCTPESLAERFGINERSIYRDISDLNSAGFAVVFDKESNSYSFADPDFTLRDFDLNDDELMALLLGRQFAHSLGRPFESAFQSLLKKAQKDTGPKTQRRAKSLEGMQQFWIDVDPIEGFEGIEKQYNAITKAMDKKVDIEMNYQVMHSQEETKRTISPYGLILHDGMWYVLGYCHLRKDVRTFAIDCIKGMKLTNRPYSIPQGFNMEDYLKSGWHMVRYGEPVEVVLRFSKDVARWIKRKKWHPAQEIEEQEDGSLIFKVRLQGTDGIKHWANSWAPHCEVIAPPEFRKEVAEEIRRLGEMYGLRK